MYRLLEKKMIIQYYFHDKKFFYKLLSLREHLRSACLSPGNPFELTPNKRTDLRMLLPMMGGGKRVEEYSTCKVKLEYCIFSEIYLFLASFKIFHIVFQVILIK